jgi:hypothetical protein
LESRLPPRRPGATTTTTATVVNASTIVTVNLIDEITVTASPILAMTIGIDVIITAMTDATTTVAMTATTGVTTTGAIVAMIAMIDHHNDRHDDRRRQDDHNRQDSNRKKRTPPSPTKGCNPNGAFHKANHEINFIVGGRQAIKSNRQTRSNAKEIGHVNTENPRPLRWSEFPNTFFNKDHWVHIPDPGTYPLVVNPIVNGAWLPKTLINGGSSLNIIFTETLRKMEFDFSKMTACDEPFYGVVPEKAAYPIGRVYLLVTFGTEENFRTEYLTFEVADFCSSYHAIFG